MSVLQYVGARYVPKLFTAADGSMEWESGAYYEPLTVVTYRNASYISRVPVPSSVGAPPENTDYWVLSGNYNAYIQKLEDDILDVKSLANKRFIICGDSYLAPANNDIVKDVAAALSLRGDQIYNAAQNGLHFSQFGGTYLSGLQAIAPSVVDPDTITDIFVFGGVNENQSTEAQIRAGMQAFASYCHSAYVNANLYVAFISHSTSSGGLKKLYDTSLSAYKSGGDLGFSYIAGSEGWLNRACIGSDSLHPNEFGIARLTRAISGVLFGKQGFYSGDGHYNLSLVAASGVTLLGSCTVDVYGYGDNFKVVMKNGVFTFDGATSLSDFKLASYSQNPVFNGQSPMSDIGIAVSIKEGEAFITRPASIIFKGDGLYITIPDVSGEQITAVSFGGAYTFIIPKLYI